MYTNPTTNQSSKLQDILELPVLADACVRGGHFFQQALDLTAHAARLAARWLRVSHTYNASRTRRAR